MSHFSVQCKEIREALSASSPTYIPYILINCEAGCQCGTNAMCKDKLCQCPPGDTGDPFVSCNEVVDCPNEGNFRTINGACYLFINELMKNNDAKILCKNKIANGRPGHLVEPKTSVTNKLINDEAKIIFGYPNYYWIGLNDIDNEGNWVYTSTGLPATSTFFGPVIHTSNTNTYHNCVGTNGDTEAWFDASCDRDRNKVICEF